MKASDILREYLSTECAVCGMAKITQKSFCGKCYRMLPFDMQSSLYLRFGEGHEEAYVAARKWLLANPTAKPAELPKVKFPATSDALRAAGYEYDNDGVCRSCRAAVEWWITPNGKKMPMTVKKAGPTLFTSGEVRESHFANCPEARSHRR